MFEKFAEDVQKRYNEKLAKAYSKLVLPEARSYMAKKLQDIRHKYPMRGTSNISSNEIPDYRDLAKIGLINAAKGIQADLGYIPPRPQRSFWKDFSNNMWEGSLVKLMWDAAKQARSDFFG